MRTTHTMYQNPFIGLVDELFNGKIFTEGTDVLNNSIAGYPPANIVEKNNTYEIELLVPARQKEDFTIELVKNKLTISYKMPELKEEETTKKIKTEFVVKSFARSFTISENIEAQKIVATYNAGILTITLHKKEIVAPEKTTIAIQ